MMLRGQGGWTHKSALLLTLAFCSTGMRGTAALQQARSALALEAGGGCSEVDVSGGEDVGTFGGKYLLQSTRFDGRAVYEKKATACERVETPGSRDAGRVEYMLRCDRQRTRPAWLYFDAKHGMWKLGDNGLGSDMVHALAQNRASTPDAVPDSAWYVSNGPHGWRRARGGGLRASCVRFPERGWHRQYDMPKGHEGHRLVASADSGCRAWRATAGCSPDGPRTAEEDQPCDVPVSSRSAGYCLCAAGRRVGYGCEHGGLPRGCDGACAIRFPVVVARSSQDIVAGDFAARNVLGRAAAGGAGGGWRSLPTSRGTRTHTHSHAYARGALASGGRRVDEWIVIDVGPDRGTEQLAAVRLGLPPPGSRATPKHGELQRGPTPRGPWTTTRAFAVPRPDADGELEGHPAPVVLALDRARSPDGSAFRSRYWRVHLDAQWDEGPRQGEASAGVGLDSVRFEWATAAGRAGAGGGEGSSIVPLQQQVRVARRKRMFASLRKSGVGVGQTSRTTGTMANGLTPHGMVLAMTLFVGLPLASYFVLGKVRETTLRGDTAYTPVMELHARGSSAASSAAGRYDGSAPPGL